MTQLEKLTQVLDSVKESVKGTAKLQKQIVNIRILLNKGGKFRLLQEGRKNKGTGTISITFDMADANYGDLAKSLFTERLAGLELEYEAAKEISDKFLADPKIVALMDALGVSTTDLLADAVAAEDGDADTEADAEEEEA